MRIDIGAKKRFMKGFIKQENGCWEWEKSRYKNYARVSYNGKKIFVHRLSWLIYFGPLNKYEYIHHECNNRCCVNPKHLVKVNSSEHMKIHNNLGHIKHARGEEHYGAKLTEENVREIRRLLDKSGKVNMSSIARDFGVNKITVRRIKKNLTWRHVLCV